MTIRDRIKKILNCYKSKMDDCIMDDCISSEDFINIAEDITKIIAKKYGYQISKIFKWMEEDYEDEVVIDFKKYRKYLLSAFEPGEKR